MINSYFIIFALILRKDLYSIQRKRTEEEIMVEKKYHLKTRGESKFVYATIWTMSPLTIYKLQRNREDSRERES